MALCATYTELAFNQTVGSQFSDGVDALKEFVTVLGNTYVRPSLTTRDANALVRRLSPSITRAYVNFSLASNTSKLFNDLVNGEVEKGVVTQAELQRQIRHIESEEKSISDRLNDLQIDIRESERQVKYARGNLARAEQTREKARGELEKKIKDREIVRGVGLGLALIPVAGWIVGGIMLAVSETALTEAVESAENAEYLASSNVEEWEDELKTKCREKYNLGESLRSKQQERRQVQSNLRSLEERLQARKNAQRSATQLSQNLKYCRTFITTTFGRTKIVRDEICNENFYTLETLQEPLEAIATHLRSVDEKKWLFSGEFRNSISSATRKFKMICERSTQPVFDQWC